MPGLVPGIHVSRRLKQGSRGWRGLCPGLTKKRDAKASREQSADWISMNLSHLLNARRAAGKPVRVALIGAGKFGSMFLSQVPHTPGLEVAVIVDLDAEPARAR